MSKVLSVVKGAFFFYSSSPSCPSFDDEVGGLSAIMMTGALVLPDTMVGITEASTTQALIPFTLEIRIEDYRTFSFRTAGEVDG
ncbi:hypothetical protein CEXT_453501 [Caerostris extrusa]|uniref:Uncharacterized protein n=1 Tax=Caerostris extrusa TaxID=172846 RepID=A0AAV4S8A6_CAEEX|nr:hypothetical protein CEXT_453501 [Caerostris extrusa]